MTVAERRVQTTKQYIDFPHQLAGEVGFLLVAKWVKGLQDGITDHLKGMSHLELCQGRRTDRVSIISIPDDHGGLDLEFTIVKFSLDRRTDDPELVFTLVPSSINNSKEIMEVEITVQRNGYEGVRVDKIGFSHGLDTPRVSTILINDGRVYNIRQKNLVTGKEVKLEDLPGDETISKALLDVCSLRPVV